MRSLSIFVTVLSSVMTWQTAACAEGEESADAATWPEPALSLYHRDGPSALLRCLDGRIPLISAHRGGPGPGFPENAVPTFAETMAQAPSLIETDVRVSADGVFVLLHDSELDRTTTGEGPVAERPWAELEPLRLVDEEGTLTTFSIPRLDEALAWADGRVLLQLDVKRGVDLQGVARAVLEADAADSTMLIAYSVEDAAAIHSVSDKLTISLGMDALGDVEAARSAGVNVNRVVAWTGLGEAVNAPFWHRLDAVGVPVAFGTMWNQDEAAAQKGDDSVYAELAVRGVDILATDRPRAAFRAVTDRAGFEAALATCGA